jgi:CHU_C Type IX secretion signal domain
MKKSILALLCSFLLSICHAQNGDCGTAIPVCDEVYNENNSPSGTGNVFEQSPNSCQTSGEFNSSWYVFTAQETGPLSFILDPNNNNDDYDWSLYNITSGGCGGINSGNSPEVSCNSWGALLGAQGSTGISSAQGGSGSSNGPGDTNGPPFNGDLGVQQGNVYALVVMNFTGSTSGYSLNFSNSQTSIFDQVDPEITSTVINCDADEVTITFSENVITAGMPVSNYTITGPGGVYTVTQVINANPDSDNQITLVLNTPITTGGSYTLSFNGFSPAVDFCGNTWGNDVTFDVGDPIGFTTSVNESCNGENGEIEITAILGGLAPYNVYLNSQLQNSNTLGPLTTGSYTIMVEDNNNCTNTQTIDVNDVAVTIDLGQDTVLCDLTFLMAATYTNGNFSWSPEPGITFSNINVTNPIVTATTAGLYNFFATVTEGDCIANDGIGVVFNYPPAMATELTGVTCNSDCNGEIKMINGNNANFNVTLDGITKSGTEVLFDHLCVGNYDATIVHSPSCIIQQTFTVSGPAAVVAVGEVSANVVSAQSPNVILTNQSMNADSIIWQVVGYAGYTSTEDIWNLELPVGIGFYQISLTAIGPNGCNDQVILTVLAQDEFKVFIPNSFTPDADGINDVFQPIFSYPPLEYEFMVFDRWGEPVFHSTDYLEPWTGGKDGGNHFVPDGAYTWLLKTKGYEADILTFQGHVVIVR